jgi:hypothetical protein
MNSIPPSHKRFKAPQTSGFRLLPTLGVEVNANRLKAYCKRLQRKPEEQRWGRKLRLKKRLRNALQKGAVS